ncbi:MAG: 50S ribosomal protein L3 N(5)-glutamine methyltransferase [Pseudomonadota bacterium]
MMNQAHQELFTLRDLLRFAVSRFSEAKLSFGHGSDNAWDEAVYLLLHTLHLPLDRLEPFLDARLTLDERKNALLLIERRITERLPVAYLTNEAWLGENRFYVDERVIVPRSFIAELLQEQLTPWVTDPWKIASVLDLCTGSGCLAILAARAFPSAQIDAVDISSDALEVAKDNIADYALQKRIQLIQSDLFSKVGKKRYDLIIANPPYVNAESMDALPDEYRHEPKLALASGEDGLDTVRQILSKAKEYLTPTGMLVVEIGHNRDALEAAFPETAFTWLETEGGDEYVFLLQASELPKKTT